MKDAIADAGDIVIDGVAAVVGFIRGDPPEEEETEAADLAQQKLSKGPAGAAYGISQASPTGGINAVWVMPEDADPSALAQLVGQSLPTPGLDPRIPRNILPYDPQSQARAPPSSYPPPFPVVAPYAALPAQATASSRASPQVAAWRGSQGSSTGSVASSGFSASRSVDRIAAGEVLAGADAARRLTQQCIAASVSADRLGDAICTRVRRLYLGLDGGDQAEADEAMARLLALVHFLWQQEQEFGKAVARVVKEGAGEELLSLRSSTKHRVEAERILQQLGLCGDAPPPAPTCDLLGDESAAPEDVERPKTRAVPHESGDLLGDEAADLRPPDGPASLEALLSSGPAARSDAPRDAPRDADLLGEDALRDADLLGDGAGPAAREADLLGDYDVVGEAQQRDLLHGLRLGEDAEAPAAPAPAQPSRAAKSGDAFSFVGEELQKAK